MLRSILDGALLGFGLSVLLGPVFFMLIETSVRSGIRSAFYMDLGVITSDMFCVVITYFGLSHYFKNPIFKYYLFIVGGVIFVIFGFAKFFSNPKKKIRAFGKKQSFMQLYSRGFMLNIVNPSVIFFWIAAVAFAVSVVNNEVSQVFAYFLATFITVMSFDLLKIWGASNLKKWLKPKRLFRLGQIIGIGFILFGFLLLFKAFY